MEPVELFPKHFISYTVPENFNEVDRWLFYDENFSFQIPATHQITLNKTVICNGLVFQHNRPVFELTLHYRLSLVDLLKAAIKLQISKREKLELGILGLQDWGNNFFHWMTEMLPRIVAMKHQHPSIPVIIPSNYLAYPFIVESLDILKIEIKTFHVSQSLKINKLYATAIPHVGRFNEGLMHFFRDKFIQEFAQVPQPFRLLYVSREKAKRRKIRNEDYVYELLAKKGFEKLILEDIPLKNQVKLFQEARLVIGCHGAGLTNIMFMQKKQTVIELKANNNNYWCYFSIARVFGLKYYYSLNNGHVANHRDADIDIDLDALNVLVTKAMNN